MVEVDGDIRHGRIAQHALQMGVGGVLDGGVDLGHRGLLFRHEFQIDHGDIGGRHADRGAIELAVQLGQHEAHSLGGAGARGDHGEGGGAGAVEILVHGVQRRLVARVGMDRGHEAMLDADSLVQHPGHRREAIGGAGGVGDDEVILRQLLVVHAEDDREIGVIARGGDQHPLGARVQMGLGLVLRGEDARAFHGDVDAQRLVGQLGGVADGGDLDGAEADIDRVPIHLHLMGEAAMHAVEAQQMGVGLHRAQIIDGHDLNVLAARLDNGAQHIAADAAKPIDRNLHHDVFLSIHCS